MIAVALVGIGIVLAPEVVIPVLLWTAVALSATWLAFEIVDGVRRSRAAYDAGQETIPGVVQDNNGTTGPVQDIPVGDLQSPEKDTIDIGTPGAQARWRSVVEGTAEGADFPPITVREGNNGTPIGKVGFDFGDEP